VSVSDTLFVLDHAKYTTMRLPAVLALLKARLLSDPEVISFARACLKAGVAAALAVGAIRGKPRRPRMAAARAAIARRVPERRILNPPS
jgi:hypothetical protein